ncbi:MAG: hypothetical protein Q4B89_04780 [Lachnospiraceae bacterium]|nr:hypothetical protein [Lachnospiraceae bacterium]
MINYYELKYLVTETFYENILQEKYTIEQSAGRCFVEFYNEEVESMNDLVNDEDIFNILKTDEVESLREDIDYINSKIDKQTDDFFEITPVN